MHQRITYLDGLRGLAVLIVVLHHFMLAFYPAIFGGYYGMIHTRQALELWIYRTPLNIIFNGNFAVYLFIILSGFALSIKFFQTKDAAGLAEAAVKRYFRLMPPILLGNLLAFLILIFGLNFNHQVAPLTHSESWLGATWVLQPNFWFMLKQSLFDVYFRILSMKEAYDTSLWTIPLFFLGTYLVLGTLALFGNLVKRYYLYTVLILLLINTHYYAFIIGLWLCDLYFNQKLQFPAKYKIAGWILLILGIVTGSYPSDMTNIPHTFYRFLPRIYLIDGFSFYHILGATLIIVGLIQLPWWQKLLSRKPVLDLGKISYSLYVIHVILLASLASFLFLIFDPARGYNRAFGVMFIIGLPVIILVSALAYRFVERPGIGLSNWVWQKLVDKPESTHV